MASILRRGQKVVVEASDTAFFQHMPERCPGGDVVIIHHALDCANLNEIYKIIADASFLVKEYIVLTSGKKYRTDKMIEVSDIVKMAANAHLNLKLMVRIRVEKNTQVMIVIFSKKTASYGKNTMAQLSDIQHRVGISENLSVSREKTEMFFKAEFLRAQKIHVDQD
jgi:hypothetical protein